LAREISNFISHGLIPTTSQDEISLAEFIQIWEVISFGKLQKMSMRPTNNWYGQILKNNEAFAYALCKVNGPRDSDWSVTGVFVSPFVKTIFHAINSFIKESPQDSELRLIDVPPLKIKAIWVTTPYREINYFKIVHSISKKNPIGELLNEEEFLTRLKGHPHISGQSDNVTFG
jgi:hypothetical protein